MWMQEERTYSKSKQSLRSSDDEWFPVVSPDLAA